MAISSRGATLCAGRHDVDPAPRAYARIRDDTAHATMRGEMTARRFVADTMLGALARWLRAMGYDTAYPGRADDGWLFELARAEHRILITRDVRLAGRAGDRACLIRSRDVDGQIVEAVQALGLVPSREDWLSRC